MPAPQANLFNFEFLEFRLGVLLTRRYIYIILTPGETGELKFEGLSHNQLVTGIRGYRGGFVETASALSPLNIFLDMLPHVGAVGVLLAVRFTIAAITSITLTIILIETGTKKALSLGSAWFWSSTFWMKR
jgi:hypothetical protein